MLAGLVLFTGGVFLVLLRWVGGIGPGRFVTGVFGATSIAFASTSTVAALPASLQEASGKLGVSDNVADLVLPLGASLYRPGSALFQGAAVVFLAHLFEVPFPLAAAGGAVLAVFLVALTIAPVPSASIFTMAPALDVAGVPLGGLGILLGIDRIPDMFRTVTNLWGQITTSVVVDRWVGGGGGPPADD